MSKYKKGDKVIVEIAEVGEDSISHEISYRIKPQSATGLIYNPGYIKDRDILARANSIKVTAEEFQELGKLATRDFTGLTSLRYIAEEKGDYPHLRKRIYGAGVNTEGNSTKAVRRRQAEILGAITTPYRVERIEEPERRVIRVMKGWVLTKTTVDGSSGIRLEIVPEREFEKLASSEKCLFTRDEILEIQSRNPLCINKYLNLLEMWDKQGVEK